MILTWTELQTAVTEQAGDDSATTVRQLKRDMNIAKNKILAAMGRETTHVTKKASLVASQSVYQTPQDCIRPSVLWIEHSGIAEAPLTEVTSQEQWRVIKSGSVRTASYPTHFFVLGDDQVDLHPAPASNLTNGLVMSYEPNQRNMNVEDVTTSTVTVTVGSATVTAAASAFSSSMVGRYFKVNDDGEWYRVSGYTSNTIITLENYYNGTTAGAGLAYTIGEAPNIPHQFHDSLIDFAMWRYYLRQKDKQTAGDFKSAWLEALYTVKQQYANKTSSNVVNARPRLPVRDIFTRSPDAVV